MSLPNQTVTFVMSNQLPADHPLMDMRVRQAISMAIDRETLTEALGFGVHIPAYQPNPAGFAGHNPDPNYGVPRYDPERAKQLLAEAGYPNGFDITLLPSIGSLTENQAVAIANYLGEIGIRCELKIVDGTELLEIQRERGWGDALFIGNYISWFTATDTANANFRHLLGSLPQWVDLQPTPEVEEMIEAINKVGDNSAEAAALSDYVVENLDLIPLWFQGRWHIIHPRVGGYKDSDHMLFFDNLYQRH
jgi:peptide/nickel transport system substrate-binding protein